MAENENKPEDQNQNKPKLPLFQVFEVKMTPEAMEQLRHLFCSSEVRAHAPQEELEEPAE